MRPMTATSPRPAGAPADTIGLASVNVATPSLLAEVDGERIWSAIAKHRVEADALWLSDVNLAGDGQAGTDVHGGTDKAVYAYPSEHLAPWAAELGQPAVADRGEADPAPFGENLSTVGLLEADVRIGDVWAWGDARLQVTQPRWPCRKLVLHRGRSDIQPMMRSNGRTGWYLRVLQVGEVPVVGPIVLAEADPAGVTVADAHLAKADVRLEDRARVEAVAAHPALAEEWRAPLLDRLDRKPAG